MRYLSLTALSLMFALSACVYEPEQFVESEKGENSNSNNSVTDMGTLYAVNDGKQICNPSVSQDPKNYPASMLWLNFGGTLKVKASDSVYTTSKVVQHDRLSVSDTSGKVLWYLMRDTEAGDCQFQDPEWSTHPNYIVALRAFNSKGESGCKESDMDYGMFAVRMSDKKKFFFYNKEMSEFATPHLWVETGAEPDTAAAESTVEGFFGTNQVRLVYVNKKDEIVFVDYANGGTKGAKTLKKPSGVDGWMMDSPMISPDGNYVVYNMINSSMTGWKSFIQELSGNSKPIEIEKSPGMISEPVQPRWFAYAERLFVMWTEFPQGSQFVNKNDLSEVSVQDGSAGRTAMREVSVATGAPADLAFAWAGDMIEIAPIPMIGGRSPDGRFVATGTNLGFLLELP
ncbi:MAG: hypothetical protein PUK29_13350 [Fibrobacter sp.]|uniref:hypothetical protein n=2 Tax=Fibrobacter sp. TaxID=35828 RepID=UPI0025B83240|nr:hypothetical protein [Fibrobacter sp.]MBS7272536.1 hypothetical protein [Fibrobacter sp.]MDD7499234.1 hypothetical protein [Fibrobacter sp.]MDY5723928.1 hypothetical protein [Fibrobacter sp.]